MKKSYKWNHIYILHKLIKYIFLMGYILDWRFQSDTRPFQTNHWSRNMTYLDTFIMCILNKVIDTAINTIHIVWRKFLCSLKNKWHLDLSTLQLVYIIWLSNSLIKYNSFAVFSELFVIRFCEDCHILVQFWHFFPFQIYVLHGCIFFRNLLKQHILLNFLSHIFD